MEARAVGPNVCASLCLLVYCPTLWRTTRLILKHVIQTCLVCLSLFRAQQAACADRPLRDASCIQNASEKGKLVGRKAAKA